MAYTYYDSETGESGIAGQPSVEEREMGRALDEKQNGEIHSFEELYGDE